MEKIKTDQKIFCIEKCKIQWEKDDYFIDLKLFFKDNQ